MGFFGGHGRTDRLLYDGPPGVMHPSREILAMSNMIAPVKLNGAPARTFCPPIWSRRSEFSLYASEASCSELSSFEVLGPQPAPDPQPGALERAEALYQERMEPLWRPWGP